jgi:hypothetical protein
MNINKANLRRDFEQWGVRRVFRPGKPRRISCDLHPGECAHVVTARALNSRRVIQVMAATKSEANASAIGILEKVTHDARRK